MDPILRTYIVFRIGQKKIMFIDLNLFYRIIKVSYFLCYRSHCFLNYILAKKRNCALVNSYTK